MRHHLDEVRPGEFRGFEILDEPEKVVRSSPRLVNTHVPKGHRSFVLPPGSRIAAKYKDVGTPPGEKRVNTG
jgi:hypothetical protein